MIELKNVTKYYHGYRAIDFIDYTFNSNRIAIFGEEQSGKSTMLRLLSGVDKVSSGEIVLNGKPVDISKDTYFTFRDGGLLNNKTIRDNLIYPLKIREEKEIESKVDSLIEEFDLTRVSNLKPKALTFDERARLILAKIKLRKTGMLLIDNPFENLDNELRKEYFNKFLQLINGYEGIVVYSTNIKEELANFEEVMLLNYGFVKGYGELENIVNNPQNLYSYSFLEDVLMYNGVLYNEGNKLVFKDKENKITICESVKNRVVPEFLPTESILSVKLSSLGKLGKTKDNITLNDLDNFSDIWLFNWNENSLIK